MTNAVIYARYSSSNQREESIVGQIRECKQYAERHGFTVIREYSDSATTGKTDRRPAFQKMIKDAEKHDFQAVLVWKLDRFARNRYDSAIYRNKLKQHGVRIYSAMEAISDSPEGIILEGLMESLAEYYSANLSENVKRGLYDSALERKILGKPPLGYRRSTEGKFEINPETAPVVQRIFDEYAGGKTVTQIVDGLNRDRIKTGTGGQFNKNSLYHLLKNEQYTGMYRYKDIVDPNGIPPIISKELFDSVQNVAVKRKKNRKIRVKEPEENYILSSVLFCGICDSPMTGESARSATGRTYKYYSCIGTRHQANNGCTKKRVSKDLIEHAVARIVNEEILTDEFIEFIAQETVKFQESTDVYQRVNDLKRELASIERKIKNLMSGLEYAPNSRAIAEQIEKREHERSELEAEIQHEMNNAVIFSAEEVSSYLHALKQRATTDSNAQQTLIESCVQRIYLFDTDDRHMQRIVIDIKFFDKTIDPVRREEIVRLMHDNPCLKGHRRTIRNHIILISSFRTKK